WTLGAGPPLSSTTCCLLQPQQARAEARAALLAVTTVVGATLIHSVCRRAWWGLTSVRRSWNGLDG
ncbi:unnamed protein product, partial [Closterium sp. NIES-53]